MALIKANYADLLGQLAEEFVRYTPASALFYHDGHNKPGLRIESVELMKEFVNEVEFGKDPEGLLFYNEKADFDNIDSPVLYKVYYNNEQAKAIKVEFYFLEQDSDPFATFLAKDSSVPVPALQDGRGIWNDLKIGACSAEIRKYAAWPTVTLTMEPIGKRVSFKVKQELVGRAIRTRGVFGFPKLANLVGHDCVATYNDDSIVFSSYSRRNKIIAVFFPTTGKLGFGDHHPHPPIATWEDL